MDYVSGLEAEMRTRYTTTSGNLLIHQSDERVLPPRHSAFGLRPFNPWKKTFNKIIRQALEARGEKQVVIKERSAVSPLTISDLQGVLLLITS